MPDDPPPPSVSSKDPIAARLLAAGTLITALAGLATAIWKPQDERVTKAAYQQCTAGIEKLNAGLAELHESQATLRGYVAAREGQSLLERPSFVVDAGAPTPVPVVTQAPARAPVQGAASKPTLPPAASSSVTYPPAAETSTAALPPPAPAPAAYHPPDFDTVLRSAK